MNKKKLAAIAVVVVILGLSSFGSYYFGLQKGLQDTKNIVIEGISGGEPPEGATTADFSVFWQAWDKLKKEHISGKEISDQNLVYGAIRGLTKSLDDPNTIFFDPEDYKKFNQDISGSFSGIGAEIGIRNDQLIVIAPLKGSPAEHVGLMAKDKILKIDDKETFDLNVDEAVKLIRGPEGTKVTSNILRNGWDKPKDFEIVREPIEIPTVDWSMKEGGIAYIQLYNFNANTDLAFYRAMVDIILEKKAEGVILDLRNNPGGYLNVAVDLAGWFLEKGDVVAKERFADGNERSFKAGGNETLKNIPMVILINGGSASASEILAGALKYNRGIKLIGEKSFGKGTVQELQELKDDSALKITVANWLLPDDSIIEKNGLTPDIEVKLTEEDINTDKDPQLDKAIEVLKQEMQV